LTEQDLSRVIAVFRKHLKDSFLVVLGGDVTVWGKARLKRFIQQLKGLNYAIVTNGVLLDESYLRELKQVGLKNLSFSADPLGCLDRARKTNSAMRLMQMAKKVGVTDRHATLTLDAKNFRDAPRMVAQLNRGKCWSEITPYIAYPSHDYDFGFFDEQFVFHMSDYFPLR